MRKPAQDRKAEIVTTVLDLADRIGPDRVTTGAVASAVGVTQAALFRHFPTKSTMWEAVADHIADQLTAAWDAALSDHRMPLPRLSALVGAQFDKIAATPAMPMLLFSRELNVENDKLRLAFRGRLVAFQALLVAEISKAQNDGALRRDLEAPDIAILITSLVQGVAIRWSLGARDFALRVEGMRLFNEQMRLLTAQEV